MGTVAQTAPFPWRPETPGPARLHPERGGGAAVALGEGPAPQAWDGERDAEGTPRIRNLWPGLWPGSGPPLPYLQRSK